MLRPSAFCDFASLPRSRSRRPSVGAMISAGASGWGVGSGSGAGVGSGSGSGSGAGAGSGSGAGAGSGSGSGFSGARGGAVSVGGGSGRRTSVIGRLGASRGIVASSPTAGRPLVSMRSFGRTGGACVAADDCVNVIPELAVYPPERSIGVAVSAFESLIRRRRYRIRPTTSATQGG